MDYVGAGLAPDDFWGLTLRQYDLHMRGAAQRIEREAEMYNRHAWSVAAMTGAAMAGKLQPYDKVFRKAAAAPSVQPPAVLEANLRALAKAWGAT